LDTTTLATQVVVPPSALNHGQDNEAQPYGCKCVLNDGSEDGTEEDDSTREVNNERKQRIGERILPARRCELHVRLAIAVREMLPNV
jgi:hypothetical protein